LYYGPGKKSRKKESKNNNLSKKEEKLSCMPWGQKELRSVIERGLSLLPRDRQVGRPPKDNSNI
jgi:hypothetical protein